MMDEFEKVKITMVSGDPEGFADSLTLAIENEKIAEEIIPILDSHDKGALPFDPSTLIVTLAASGGVLTTLIGLIQSKLTKDKTVSLELEGSKLLLTGVNDETQQELIRLWVKQVSKKQNRKVRK